MPPPPPRLYPFLLLLLACGSWWLVYQLLPPQSVAIGGDPQTRRRGYDDPLLAGFNAPQPGDGAWWDGPPYRWSMPSAAIALPGVGGVSWLVRLRAASGRPDGAETPVRWRLGDRLATQFPVSAQPRVYHLVVPAADGDLRLALEAPLFVPPDDPRALGVVIYRLVASPLAAPGLRPLPLVTLVLLLALAGGAVCCARSRREAIGLTATAIGITSYLLAWHRLELTMALPAYAALSLAAAALWWIWRLASRRTQWRELPARAVLAAFALRMAGMLHPYARHSDLSFNVHNLAQLVGGGLIQTAGLPCEAGAGLAPYPPAQYLWFAPAGLLLPYGERAQTLLLQGGVALVESLGAALVWLILRRAGGGQRAGLLGAWLYVGALPLLRSYAVGEMANLFAQALLLPLLLVLLLAGQSLAKDRPVALGALALTLCAIALSHAGTTISAAAIVAAWLLALLPQGRVAALLRSRPARSGWTLVLAGGVPILYYSAYLWLPARNLAARAQLAAAGTICPPGNPFVTKIGWELAGATAGGGSTPPLLLLAGGLGLALVWAGGAARRPLRWALLAGWGGAALSFGTLLGSDQAVRWQHALFPVLCIGGGVALAAFWRRGRAGGLAAAGLLAWLLCYAAQQWAGTVASYLH